MSAGVPGADRAADAARPLRGARVLIVEDNVLVADVVCTVLRRAGAEVLGPVGTAAEGVAAVALGPRAALLDADLRGESGEPVALACCRARVPFAVVTGFDASVTRAWGCRGCATLEKPVRPAELVEMVGSLLRGERVCVCGPGWREGADGAGEDETCGV